MECKPFEAFIDETKIGLLAAHHLESGDEQVNELPKMYFSRALFVGGI